MPNEGTASDYGIDVAGKGGPAGKNSVSGKIFVGGLSRVTTTEKFTNYFKKYGEIVDSVVMKDPNTGHPRGFGFITYLDPSVIDQVIKENHVIDGKTVEIKRSIPRGTIVPGPKTKKIFVGGIPTSLTADEFKNYFSKFGPIVDHQIMQDRASGRSRGFGFITFDSEHVVDYIISQGKMHEIDGKPVEIKKAEPKKPAEEFFQLPPVRGAYGARDGAFNDYGNGYAGLSAGGYGPVPYRPLGGGYGGRGGYGNDSYRGYGTGGVYGTGYGDSLGRDYGGGIHSYGAVRPNVPGGYGDDDGYGAFGYGGGGHETATGYGSRYGGGRYHPYGRS